ncbi:hypothetical protein [Streptococcus sp. 27098_8_69]|uniref:hypothetical protein n=1 Tax=Streptococcus TaxID=1301 RepID=UPI00352DD720
MKKIGSEFLREFETEDRPILFGLTGRMIVLYVCLVIAVSGSITIYFFGLPDWYIYLWDAIFVLPGAMYGTGMTKRIRIKEKINFFFRIQQRSYETEFGKVGIYTKDEFIQKQKRKTRKRRKEKN